MTFDEPLVSGVSEQGVTEETHTHTHAKLTGLDGPLSCEDVQLLSILSLQSSVHWETERDTISVNFDLFWLLLIETELQYLQHIFGIAGRGVFDL